MLGPAPGSAFSESIGLAAGFRGSMPIAAAIAVIIHLLLLLGVGFELPVPAQPPVRTLEVMTVEQPAQQARTPQPDAVRAQASRAGETPIPLPEILSGTAPEAPRMEPPAETPEPVTAQAPEVPTDAASRSSAELPEETSTSPAAPRTGPGTEGADSAQAPGRPLLDTAPDTIAGILTGLGAEIEVPDLSAAATPAASMPNADARDILATRGAEIAALTARINARTVERAGRERRKAISTETREYRYAAYMEAWRRKVERIGNLNYPREAKARGLYGSLILHVAIRADGSLEGARVVRSSGHEALDQAALDIVALAAPYAPFPDDINAETDVLDITRVWQFQPNNRLGWDD
jgi:protein TonB